MGRIFFVAGVFFYFLLGFSSGEVVASEKAAASDKRFSCDNSKRVRQGWSEDCWQWFYHATQGSRLLSYQWFEALNQHGEFTNKLVDDLGYLHSPVSDKNIPPVVGFTRNTHKAQGDEAWLGMSCAACHTAEIPYRGKKIWIDGGAGMGNISGLLRYLYTRLSDLLENDEEFTSFAEYVLRENYSFQAANNLRHRVREKANQFYHQSGIAGASRNYTPHRYGFGRVDAIGLLMNEMAADKIDKAENIRMPNAPVSIPPLWYIPRYDRVQWNASLRLPFGRNVGEVLGVFAEVTLPKDLATRPTAAGELFQSSIDVQGLDAMENLIDKLRPPRWPPEFPPIKDGKLPLGKMIYKQNCLACHTIIDTEEAKLVHVKPVYVSKAGTDPLMTVNASCRTAVSTNEKINILLSKGLTSLGDAAALGAAARSKELGDLHTACASLGRNEPLPNPAEPRFLAGQITRAVVSAVQSTAVWAYYGEGTDNKREQFIKAASDAPTLLGHKYDEKALGEVLSGGRPTPLVYKAGPLHGIWATAPYLHNGSIPTLRDLLKPEGQRTESFCVGPEVEFNPRDVGLQTDGKIKKKEKECGKSFFFNTRLPGNWNTGHTHGTDGTDGTDRTKNLALQCEDGNDDDACQKMLKTKYGKRRDALIEYLKTL